MITDWKNNKGLGPWDFQEQRNKWGYLNNPRWQEEPSTPVNYDGIEDQEPQVWNMLGEEGPYSEGNSIRHKPCGHWHKEVEVLQGLGLETYIEILSSGCCFPSQQYATETEHEDGPLFDATFKATYRSLNTEDYTGKVTYTFEILCANVSEKNPGFAYLVDEDDNIVATIEVPKDTRGPYAATSDGEDDYNYRPKNYFVYSVEFTPKEGEHQYALRSSIANTGYRNYWDAWTAIFKIANARIIIRQLNATASVAHIPMFTLVNWCQMDWDSNIEFGDHVISAGTETGSKEIEGTTYAECDNQSWYGNGGRQVWKYNEADFKKANKIVFDAGVSYIPSETLPSPEDTLYGTPDFVYAHMDLRWSDAEVTSAKELSGTPGDNVVYDGDGNAYHYIPYSIAEWCLDDDGSVWKKIKTLDLTDLADADGKYLYFCSQEGVYGDCSADGALSHYGSIHNFSIPAGRHLVSATMTYTLSYNDSEERYEIHREFEYELSPADIRDAWVILWDRTADVAITESELHFDKEDYESWRRLSVELNPSLFTDGHEYETKWKKEDIEGEDPEVTDVNLWVKVTDLSVFTSWLRVIKQSMGEWRYPGVYQDWYSDSEQYYLDISSRARPFIPTGAEVSFELGFYDMNENTGDIYDELINAGSYVQGIGDNETVEDSRYSIGEGLGHTNRVRVEDFELESLNYHICDIYGYYWGAYMPQSGFILVKITS